MNRKAPTLLAGLTFLAVIPLPLAGCGSDSDGSGSSSSGKKAELSLVAYSTPQEAYEQIIPAFQKTSAGNGVTFKQSYGASGDQSRAVESGLKADVVAFSLAPDVTRLVDAKLVDANWDKDEYQSNVTDSVVVLTVRKGNPKNIKSWADLTKPGVDVLIPNPFTSGGAKWDVMAAYGAQLEQDKSEQEAISYLKSLYKNVSVQDKAARDALQTFVGGKGDVLIGYENEAITAQQKGEKVAYVVPDQTILIENPIAVVSDSKYPDQAKAFVEFARSPAAQRIFGKKGYRPVDKKIFKEFDFEQPSSLFTIKDVGGWSEVNDKFFDPEKGVLADIEKGKGVSIAK